MNQQFFSRCYRCDRISEIVYSRVKPCADRFAALHFCIKCVPSEPLIALKRADEIAQPKALRKTGKATPAAPAKQQKAAKRSGSAKQSARSQSGVTSPASPEPTQAKSRLKVYGIRQLQGGGIIPSPQFYDRLSQYGAVATQIRGQPTFQVAGAVTGVIVCQIQSPERAVFRSANPVIHDWLN